MSTKSLFEIIFPLLKVIYKIINGTNKQNKIIEFIIMTYGKFIISGGTGLTFNKKRIFNNIITEEVID